MTPQRLLDSRTELPAPLPPCEGRRVRQPAPQPSALGLAGSDACGVGPVCVPQGWPPRNRAARHTARSEKGKTGAAGLKEVPARTGPEHGVVTRASVCPLTPNPPQPAKAPVRFVPWQTGPAAGVLVHSPGSRAEGSRQGRWAPGATPLVGRSQPCGAEERGQHPAPS